MEHSNSKQSNTEEGISVPVGAATPSSEFVSLVKHSISCQCDFGKCAIPECAILQRIMAFLSPAVAQKRNRIDQQVYGRKRTRVQAVSKRGQTHATKVIHRTHVPPPKGEFIHNHVEYSISRSGNYRPLLSTLTKVELNQYIQYLRSRSIQTYYGPLLQLLMQHKDNHGIFNTPVNPETQNLPTYYSIVEHPMDLGTIRDNLMCGRYQFPRDLIYDIRLVFQNAKKFNPETHFVNQCATQMLKTLDVELEKVRSRYEQNRITQYNHTCSSCRGYPCLICGEKCLKYSPPVYVCDGDCRERILRNTTYYVIRGKKGRYCPKCYAKKVVGMDKTERKNLFVRKKNDEVFPESWVQCSRCHEWMHCVCGLIHPREVTSSYVCPLCLAADPHRVPRPEQGSPAIHSCPLSDFLTAQINHCVDEEMKKQPPRMRLTDAALNQLKASLIVRVVSNITSSVTLKKQLAPLFTSDYSNTLSIPYQSKCIAFFQHRDGVDILLFMLYVHEFGDQVIPPNRRCIYISYLDSVHFLTPRYLRTPIYHCILNSYLQYAKENGYCRAHIWACPPSRGDDYIFSHHPRDQRTPNADHLIGWYRNLLAKGVDSGVISHVTCQLDQLLHMNAVWSNNAELNQRQIRCFSVRGLTEGELPEAVLERVLSTTSTVTQDVSSDYESENENPSESELSSDTSTVSTISTSTPLPQSSDISPRPAARAVPSGFLTELERALLTTVPYFEGDFLPYIGEDLLKEIYQESLKPKPTRSVSAFVVSNS